EFELSATSNRFPPAYDTEAANLDVLETAIRLGARNNERRVVVRRVGEEHIATEELGCRHAAHVFLVAHAAGQVPGIAAHDAAATHELSEIERMVRILALDLKGHRRF